MGNESDERKRKSTGEYELTVSESDALEAVREGGHVVTTKEVADAIDASRDTALRRLKDLHESGRVERKDLGAGTVWWAEDDDE